ncbi:MAG: thioredoxin [Planctomycetes bacterium]|nr:thioredoxin [Planctomycetota bacterium]
MAEHIAEFTDANFQTEVLESAVPVLVDFWAPWCGPCKALAPTIDALAKEFAGKVRVGKLNTDDNPSTPSNYNISGIPTVILFKGGEVVGKIVGLASKDKLTASLNQLL